MIDLDHITPAGDIPIPDLLELHEGLMPHVEHPEDVPADPAAEPLDGPAAACILVPDDGGELVDFYLDFYKTVKSL